MKHELIVIGGGAAGIMAAITAKDLGVDVAIIEANDRIGKKILATGNGRCNITNSYATADRYHSENYDFYAPVLNAFDTASTKIFFNSLGLSLIELEEGKLYPMSLQASSVLDIFRLTLEEKSIPIYVNNKVKNICISKNSFKIVTVSEEIFYSTKIILAAGGSAAPKTGSDGNGYSLAKQLGHNVIKPLPALVQLKLDHHSLKALAGIKFDGTVSVFTNGKCLRKEPGEVLFTDYGISGPPILQVSRAASYELSKRKNVALLLDMFPAMEEAELIAFLENHWGTFSYRSVHDSLIGIINKKLIPIVLKEAKISSIHKPCMDLTWEEKKSLIKLFKSWEFIVSATNIFGDAQVTAGGVDTLQINSETLESKLVKNLYFAGEIVDVDGDCGGFNLQWAWSSGYISAKSASVK